MSDKEEKKSSGSVLSRVGFSGWMLFTVGVTMLALHLCKNQGTIEHLDEWDFYLRDAGRVLLLSASGSLEQTAAKGAEVVSWEKFPKLKTLSMGGDISSFSREVEKAGFNRIIAGTDVLRSPGAPEGSILERLATFQPVEGIHPLMIRPEGAIYEVAKPPEISMEKLRSLVKLVRDELSSGTATGGDESAEVEENKSVAPDVEVAIQIQGLKPAVIKKKSVFRVRRDLFVSGRGKDLRSAAMEAVGKIKAIFEKNLAGTEGNLSEAVKEYTVELHVLYDFSLVAHLQGDMDSGTYQEYINSVFRPGLYGVYINRMGGADVSYLYRPRSKFRLPVDAVWWLRASGRKILDKIIKDMNLGTLNDFAGNNKITVDRFRTIHAVEETPGGAVNLYFKGTPLVSQADVTKENIKGWGKKAAQWLGRSLKKDGMLAVSYLPDRDHETIERTIDLSFNASRYILAAMAFQDAAEMTNGEEYDEYFERTIPAILSWLKVCPDAHAASAASLSLKAYQAISVCGPMRRNGMPSDTATWGQGGEEEKEIPGDLVFMFANTRAGIRETALAGLMLANDLMRTDKEGRKEKEKKYLPLIEGIVQFVLFMQRENGSFQSYFVEKKNAFYRAEDPSGGFVAALFLLKAAEIVKDERIQPALESALGYHIKLLEDKAGQIKSGAPVSKKEEKDNINFFGWGFMSLATLSISLGDENSGRRLVETAAEISNQMQLDKTRMPLIEDDLEGGFTAIQAMPDYRTILMTRGLIHAAEAARHLDLKAEEEILRRAALLGMRFSSQLQLRYPGNTLSVANSERTDGGIRQSPLISRQRIDFTAHFIGACKEYLAIK